MREGRGRLAGKVATITGAGKGTGAAMDRQFIAESARMLQLARSEDTELEMAAGFFIGRPSASRQELARRADGGWKIVPRQNYMLDGDLEASKLLGRLGEGARA